MSDDSQTIILTAASDDAGMRLDVFLAGAIEDASRSFLQKLIKSGAVTVGRTVAKRPSRTLAKDDAIIVELPPPPISELVPEDIPLEVLYEDAELIVVNKPSGLVVHPAPGHYTGTLVHAVLFHCKDFQSPESDRTDEDAPIRPGIVHRLDRYTSGAMVVAKTQRAFDHLARQAREHTFDRRYVALVRGEFKEDAGSIDAAIGRSLAQRGKMAVTSVKSRDAVTHFEVLERFGVASLIALQLETGRTHQIRVHLRFAGRVVLGDPVYGTTEFGRWDITPDLRAALCALDGQALHAELLGIEHPVSGERMLFHAPLPNDFQSALDALRDFAAA